MNWFSLSWDFFFQKILFHVIKKPYVVSYSKRHLELRNINDFQSVFEFVEFFFVDVLIVNFLLPFYIVFLFEEISFVIVYCEKYLFYLECDLVL